MSPELEFVRSETDRATQGISPNAWVRGPNRKWSSLQILEHLVLSYTATTKGLLRATETGLPQLETPDLRQRLRRLYVLGLGRFPSGQELALLDSVVGAVFGAGFFYLGWALYYLVRKRQGMGFGDIALIAMIGAFLGLKLTVLVVFFAPIIATLFAVVMLAIKPNASLGHSAADHATKGSFTSALLSREVPFGVFLGTSALIALFFGEQIWSWYLRMFR